MVERFGGGGEGGAGAEVVGSVEAGAAGLVEGVRGDADEFAGAEEGAGVLEGEVVLAEVDAVGVGGGG